MRRVLACTVAILVMSGCSGGDDDDARPTPTATTSSTSTSPTPSPTTTATATESADPAAPPIDYDTPDDSGVVVGDADGAEQLNEASPDFKKFIADEVERLQAKGASGCKNKPQIRVSKLQPAGWAAGGVFTPECGGGDSVLWAKTGGQWAQVWSGQQLPECVTLMKYKFPASVAGQQCLGQNGTAYDYKG